MRPSKFLQKRHQAMMHDIGGSVATVKYYPLTKGASNGLGDMDDSFPSIPIELDGLVDYFPSPVTRASFGRDTNFECTVRLNVDKLSKANISISIGDKFELPGTQQQFFVTGIPQPTHQAAERFLELLVPLTRKSGRRG